MPQPGFAKATNRGFFPYKHNVQQMFQRGKGKSPAGGGSGNTLRYVLELLRGAQRLEHRAQGLAPMAHAELSFRGNLAEGAIERGVVEERIVAESVRPFGL